VLVGAAGFTTLVPTVLRTLDGVPSPPSTGAIGFGASTFCVAGIVLQQFPLHWLAVLVSALALGFAVAAIHPEILRPLQRRSQGTIGMATKADAD